MNAESKGILLVLLTAIISGFSIYLNKFAVSGMNPFVLTTLKNASVALLLFAFILFFAKFNEIKQLSKRQWKNLFVIGITGGSTAFLLFFYGLSITSAVNAGFLHKTLFIFASVFAIILLKEKTSKKMFFSAVLVFAALVILFSLKLTSFNVGDLLILAAVLLWGFEITIAKKILQNLSGSVVAFGRMFFGSLIMLAFLALSGQAGGLFALNTLQFEWVFITSVLLFLYVITFYNGLKFLEVSKAAIILLAAVPITALLSVFDAKLITALELFANFLIVFAVLFACLNTDSLKQLLKKMFLWKA